MELNDMDLNAGLIHEAQITDRSTGDQLETIKHGKYHSLASKCLIVAAITGFVCYSIYGIDKINSSQTHPETKSDQLPVSNYDLPAVFVCTYWPLWSGFSQLDYFYYGLVTNNPTILNSATFDPTIFVCENKFKYSYGNCSCDFNYNSSIPCDPYITDDYTEPLNRAQWTVLKYNKTNGPFYQNQWDNNLIENCWAIIPPRNAEFNLLLDLEFVHIPTEEDVIYFNNTIENTVGILTGDAKNIQIPAIIFAAIHPDGIDDWYLALQKSQGILSNTSAGDMYSAGFPWHFTSLWKTSEIYLSLYTTKTVSNEIKHVYDTNLVSDRYSKDLMQADLNLHGNGYKCNECPPLFLPKFAIIIDVNAVALDNDAIPVLFQTYTTEYAGYTWVDLMSGMGGFIGSIITIIGIIFGVLLNGDYISSLCKWQGFAPYPPFDEHFQVRIKRLVKKE